MRLQHLTESSIKGSFVGVKLTTESNARLVGWMDQNLIKNPLGPDKLHVTLVLNKTGPIRYHPITYPTPVPIDPSTYSIDLFGKEKNIMVLKFDCPFLEDRHNKLRERHGLSWDFPTYSPHITLTHEVQEIITELEPPNFELEIGREYLEEFNLDAAD